MIPTLLRRLRDTSRLLYVRVLLIALLAIVAIGLAKIFGRLIPPGLEGLVGADTVDQLLRIIADSMLAVTTFSLGVMAATHRAVSSTWTPRAHQILLQDTTTHTVLATFVGAYLYALLAIILRDTEVFRAQELVVLFGVTCFVLLLIIVAIIRWISHLEVLGSLIETASRVEDQTAIAFDMRCEHAALGCHPLREAPPEDTHAVRARDTGFVQQIFQDVLQDAAETADAKVWLLIPVGRFVHRGEVLARISRADETLEEAVHRNISIGSLRNFTQDPHFGLLCLSEIGQRALSPGVNDPGTAIDITGRIARILMRQDRPMDPGEVLHDRLWVPPLDRAALITDTLEPLARDGAGQVEVGLALRRSLTALRSHPDPVIAETAAAVAIRALDRAKAAMTHPHDLERLTAL
ncbi:DUF2254 domain-containing protein [Pseudooceanicola nanhaiensis]|uniref:DUF2254 domain-containing protein n=1 Tax=Pseudooceanicola nanhaiensis TaxID=375761 RepID=UPI001CD41AD9|nr:DUF2254 domain-containing protein [Pseudooceanicola nanhaiensis]MCA0919956.1 DUF2254 domain-containing protein [Pseudooceanicola nanhaiensis]